MKETNNILTTVRINKKLWTTFKKWLIDQGKTFSSWLRAKMKEELTK